LYRDESVQNPIHRIRQGHQTPPQLFGQPFAEQQQLFRQQAGNQPFKNQRVDMSQQVMGDADRDPVGIVTGGKR
jgi:hypothetical protein